MPNNLTGLMRIIIVRSLVFAMFNKFALLQDYAASSSIPPSNRSKVKSSVQRGLRQKLLETYPGLEPFIEDFMPKKASLEAVKLPPPSPYPRIPLCRPDSPDRPRRHPLCTLRRNADGSRSYLSGGRLPDAEHALEAGQIVGVKAEGRRRFA
ncbi:hypothetical protein PDIDSM_1047 [Penicillium digitatum]|nr:hypothetical protein PDIDSM_1047 [Penicillium digitatum]